MAKDTQGSNKGLDLYLNELGRLLNIQANDSLTIRDVFHNSIDNYDVQDLLCEEASVVLVKLVITSIHNYTRKTSKLLFLNRNNEKETLLFLPRVTVKPIFDN